MKKITQLERLASLDDLYNKMQATFKKDPSNIFAYIAMFYQIYCTNGQTYLKKDLDNSKHPKVIPIIFKGFLQTHKMEDLADAYQNAGSAGNSTAFVSWQNIARNMLSDVGYNENEFPHLSGWLARMNSRPVVSDFIVRQDNNNGAVKAVTAALKVKNLPTDT